ncbi:hypothetical protein [Microbulbifer sp. SAOS-129_SWC]|uniref:hypothetical protein n=1 Tax=Microbulbifer sp. SAOS-129_SWC TaxID=3145235 RepID=UPI0032180361
MRETVKESLKESLKDWWANNKEHEKRALLVLGAIFCGIFIFVSGISVGRAVAALI